MKNKEPWSFCETPKEKCTVNYCDENGCQNRKRNYVEDNDANLFLAEVVDSLPSIDDSISQEALLRKMIDHWCLKQLGNTDEALEVSDKMFTAAKDIFYNVTNQLHTN